MTGTNALHAIAALLALGLALAAGGAARAQVTFQSAEVLGTSAQERAGGATGSTPVRHTDKTVRFWSDDRRSYLLEGFGCRFELSPWPKVADEAGAVPASILESDIELYRKAAGAAVAEVGDITPILAGALYRVSDGQKGPETYGLECSSGMETAVALDVLRVDKGRQLRIFIVQIDREALARGETAHKTMVVAFMQNVLFRRGDEETLARASPVTKDLYEALSN